MSAGKIWYKAGLLILPIFLFKATLNAQSYTFLNATGSTLVCGSITGTATLAGKFATPSFSFTCTLGTPYTGVPNFTLGADGPISSPANVGTGTYEVSFSSPVTLVRIWVYVMTSMNNYLYDPDNNIIITNSDSIKIYINGSLADPSSHDVHHIPGYNCMVSPTVISGNSSQLIVHPVTKALYLESPASGINVNACIEIVLNDYLNINSFRIEAKSPFGPNGMGVKVAASCMPPLPLVLTDFTAKKQNNDVLLEWITASEINVNRFEIEVAKGPGDNQPDHFLKIGEVRATGNSAAQTKYSFTDIEMAKSGKRSYRLKMIDNDGTEKYSPVRLLTFKSESKWNLYPNPSDGLFNIEFLTTAKARMTITIYDLTGKIIRDIQYVSNNGGVQRKEIDLRSSNYVPGLYMIKIDNGYEKQTFKIFKR